MLVSKEHAKHEYGFFAEVAPSYHKKLVSEKSQITAQESSISSALGEIEAAETAGISATCIEIPQ